jgi:glycosyltransferase involved in cell wall biosynthesis
MPPAVSIILPCRNERRHIETCLRSVLALEEPAGGFEVIVADGMSDDGTRDILSSIAAADPRVRVIDNPQRITPTALNAAIRAARAPVIARIDSHTEYAPDYLVQCLAVSRETGADNVGGPALTRASGYMHRAVAAAYHSRFAVGNSPFHQAAYEGPADTVPYGCWPRAVFDRVGLFDEELVRNQDDEHNFRIHLAGGKVWQSPRIRSWYTPRASLSQLFRQYFQYGYWKVRVIQKHGQPASIRHLVPGAFAASLLLLGVLAPFLPLAAWVLAGLAGLYGVCVVGASALTAAKAGWDLLPALPAVFAAYHLGYGYGFLMGSWDFVVRRRGGRFVQLTRPS